MKCRLIKHDGVTAYKFIRSSDGEVFIVGIFPDMPDHITLKYRSHLKKRDLYTPLGIPMAQYIAMLKRLNFN